MAPEQHVVADLTAVTAGTETGEQLRRLARPVIQLLALGSPVAVEEIARATGMAVDEVERDLHGLPDVEWDDAGRVIGLGLTIRPTEHALEIEGRTLYTWCAFDTVLIAALLERPVTIRSRDHAAGRPVRVETGADRLVTVEPPTTVVSWVGQRRPEELAALRANFCEHIHFFGAADAAAGWLAGHPGGALLPVADAYEAARRLAAGLFAGQSA